jgi:two-component system, OmpR family, phosphate regulon sensor histidine kinase PhoR
VQSQRMQSLVSDLLTLSRLEGSPLPSMQEWTPLSTLMVQCEQEARALSAALTVESVALGKQHHIYFAPPPALCVAGSSSEWLSAFSNLINNAVRYTPAGGVIKVTWDHVLDEPHSGGKSTSRWVFSVHDTGPGIAPEHIPRLSERFYRVDRSRSRETGGTGLGLAIVKHVLQRHGAVLGISSTPGQGSRFSVTLPGERVR